MKRLFWEAHRTDQWVSAVGTATRLGPGGALRASFTWCELQRSSELEELYTDANATDTADTNNRFAVNVSSRHRVIVSLSQTVISKDCSASFDRVCLAGQPGRSISRPYWTSSVWPPQQTCQTFRQPGAQARCPRHDAPAWHRQGISHERQPMHPSCCLHKRATQRDGAPQPSLRRMTNSG